MLMPAWLNVMVSWSSHIAGGKKTTAIVCFTWKRPFVHVTLVLASKSKSAGGGVNTLGVAFAAIEADTLGIGGLSVTSIESNAMSCGGFFRIGPIPNAT